MISFYKCCQEADDEVKEDIIVRFFLRLNDTFALCGQTFLRMKKYQILIRCLNWFHKKKLSEMPREEFSHNLLLCMGHKKEITMLEEETMVVLLGEEPEEQWFNVLIAR